MFDISWGELVILAIVTLVFVGPKDLPVFLRTIGKYAGAIKRQATEIRSQFDAAMREAELEAMQKEVEGLQKSVNAEVMSADASLKDASQASKFDPTSITSPQLPSQFQSGQRLHASYTAAEPEAVAPAPAVETSPAMPTHAVNPEPMNPEPMNPELMPPMPAVPSHQAAPAKPEA